MGSFPEGVLEPPACDETGNMSGIIARDGSNLSDDLAQFAHGLGEKSKRSRLSSITIFSLRPSICNYAVPENSRILIDSKLFEVVN